MMVSYWVLCQRNTSQTINEYYEKRHFDSGVSFPDSINLFGEDVPSGLNMIFTAKCGHNEVPFAIESAKICGHRHHHLLS